LSLQNLIKVQQSVKAAWGVQVVCDEKDL